MTILTKALFLSLITFPVLVGAVRVYPYLLDPRENPDYDRYAVTHPPLDVFNPLPQFATLREFPTEHSQLINYTQLIDKYCLNPLTALGGILWPRDPAFMFAGNYRDFVEYVKDKGLYMTSVHGFSPVSAGYRPPKDVLEYLESTLGEKWFGIANGEQDGHYFGAFIGEELPLNNNPIDQYIAFRDYFDKMESILGPKMTTLLSSTYPHYQLKTGLYTMAGAETSQHGPNAQLRYSFIRGAGKQYGVLWFGNVSVYNRFGHKVYNKQTNKKTNKQTNKVYKSTKKRGNLNPLKTTYVCTSNMSLPGYGVDPLGDPFGPTCGTSLNLMKRLMYAHMMYNSGYVSFEGGWFYDDNKGAELSPIGLIQHNAYEWISKGESPSLGVHLTTVALYLDYFNGWTPPRLKRGVIYRTWTNLPYTSGDYLTDNLLRMIYPSYQDASYFHDETGVHSATPYGDIVDVLLSDAPLWVLQRYDTVIVSSQHTGGAEVETKLFEYVEQGGNLVITAGNLDKLPRGYFNVTVSRECIKVSAGAKVYLYEQQVPIIETCNMTVCQLDYTGSAETRVIARLADSTPLAVQFDTNRNGGSLIVLSTPYAISSTQLAKPVSLVDSTLTTPFPMLDHTAAIFNNVLTNASIIQSTANLSIVTNYIDTNHYLVLVTNPELKQLPLRFTTKHGVVTDTQEYRLDQSEKGQVGYLPDGYENADIGESTPTTIAGGDTRLFKLTGNLQITKMDKIHTKPRPKGVSLHLRHIQLSIRREILSRPTFFQHYDSVVIDYSYLITKDNVFLTSERVWLTTQGVRVFVDASPSINLFPTLRLTNDAHDLYNESMRYLTAVMNKMNILGSQDLIISLHLFPGDQTKETTIEQFNYTLHYIKDKAKQLDITLHLLDTPKNQYELMPMSRWLDTYGLTSIKFVLNLARLVDYGYSYKYDDIIASRTSMLYVNAPGWDLFGNKYTDNLPIHKTNKTMQPQVTKMLTHVCSLVRCPYNTSNNNRRPSSQGEEKRTQPTHRDEDKDIYLFNRLNKNYMDNHTLGGGSNCTIVMDAVFNNQDEEYEDVQIIEQLLVPNNNTP